jgi:mono/diheme cytochrome c family protein
VAALLTAPVTTSVLAADADNGERLARRWCSACHVVAANQSSPTSEAPPFAAIARSPGRDTATVAMFLLRSHPNMPDMGLTAKEATDLAAYISTLK